MSDVDELRDQVERHERRIRDLEHLVARLVEVLEDADLIELMVMSGDLATGVAVEYMSRAAREARRVA